MTMKLSAIGLEKVENYSSVDLEIEGFEQDDFEDIVVLSVEEAKGILWDLRDLYKQTYGREWVKAEPWFDEFKNRIARAEAVQLCADYNKALNRVAEELQRQADIDICRGMDLDTTYSDMLKKTIKEDEEND